MTFSVVGYCAQTGMTGVAITTSSISVGSRCPWVRAGVGAVTTQNVTDPRIGVEVLDLLSRGNSADDAIREVMLDRSYAEYRQVAAVDNEGRTAHFTGKNILGLHAISEGRHCVAAGNLLTSIEVPTAMAKTFETDLKNPLAERLLLALEAGIEAGGEEGPTHSAALLVAHQMSWPLVDLRVDWSERPVADLRLCWQIYEPQMDDYMIRALNPNLAPSYGVPGDE